LAGPDSLAAKIERENERAHAHEKAERERLVERADWAAGVCILRVNESEGAAQAVAQERLDALDTALAAFEDHRISGAEMARVIEEVAS
jgi:hypothetical protein